MNKMIMSMGFVAAIAFAPACTSCKDVASSRDEKDAKTKIAVFVGNGARSTGAFRWVEIATTAENVEATPVDGAAIRAGALDGMDVIIMPGGRASLEAADLGAAGREKLKAFIRGGGGYIGTCAGCYLVTQPSSGLRKNYLGLIPYSDGTSGGKADINIAFNGKATELAGIKKGVCKVTYAGGPVPRHVGKEVEGSHIEVVGTYAGNINASRNPRKSFAGKPAALAGTCGKGRLFVFTVHPEVDVDDHYLVRGALRYVTRGREIKWKYPQRKPGQLSVGFMCDDSFGPETARLIQKMLKDREFDVVPINAKTISEGAFKHLDAVLAPANTGSDKARGGLYGDNAGLTREFLARGGRVLAWGNSAKRAKKYESGVTIVENGEAALAALRALAAEPPPPPFAKPAKVAKPIKAAFYADKGGAQYNVAEMLEFAPEYDVVPLSAADIANGALEGKDVLLMPGGSSKAEFNALGPAGQEAVRKFVRGGGGYFGICAGAFLVRQSEVGLGLVPFKDDKPEHYRGWAPMDVKFTEEGEKVFEGSEKIRNVMYWGGPVFVPGEPVDDSDVKVLAKYNGQLVNTCSPKPVKPMFGKGAVLGGRVGKGRVFAQGPHPEMWVRNYDLVRAGFKFLTGVAPSPVNRGRRRGTKAAMVKFSLDETSRDQMSFYLDRLLVDDRLDVILCRQMNNNALPHAEVFAILQPTNEIWSWDGKSESLKKGGKIEWSRAVADFVRGGGKVVLLADTDDERKAAAGLEGVKVVGSLDEVHQALVAE